MAERDLLALPVRLGGMGLVNPVSDSAYAFEGSKHITAPLVVLIISQDPHQTVQLNDLLKEKNLVKKQKKEILNE